MSLQRVWVISLALFAATFGSGYAALLSRGGASLAWNVAFWFCCTAFFVSGTVLLIKYFSKSLSDPGMMPITACSAMLGLIVASPVGLKTIGLSVVYPLAAAIVALAMMTAVRLYKRG